MDDDLGDLIIAWLGGDIPAERRSAVLARLEADPEFRAAVAAELRLLGMLKVLRGTAPRWLRLEDEIGWSQDEDARPEAFADTLAAQIDALPPLRPAGPDPVERHPERPGPWRAWLAAALLLAVVGWIGWQLSPGPAPVSLEQRPVALVARLHGPGWAEAGPAEGETVRAGKLHLLGGTATLAFYNGVTLHIDGPTELDIQGHDQVYCRRGRVRIDASADGSGFTVQAPGASVSDTAAEFALTVQGDQSQFMVFEGQADIAQLGANGVAVSRETLTEGQAVRLGPRAGIVREPAWAEDFAGPIPHLQPRLVLEPEYPALVHADRPASYWRFETAEAEGVPNEVPGGPALRLIGQAAPGAAFRGNRSLNFPPPTEWEQHGALGERPWTPTGKSYAVECWVMPRAVRQAAVLGLVADSATSELRQYGVLLELTGQPALFRNPEQAIRALHRQTVEQVRGTNLFAPTNYVPYRWHHVVAQKSGDRFELYVNGDLAAVTPLLGEVRLPPVRVLLGALYARRDFSSVSSRPFLGLIDEVAVYDRDLPPADIARRARLGLSVPATD